MYMSELLSLRGSHKIKFLELAVLLALVSLPTPSASQVDNTTLPVTYSVNSVEWEVEGGRRENKHQSTLAYLCSTGIKDRV